MAEADWHKRYHKATLHSWRILTLEERGALVTIMDYMYHICSPIDNDPAFIGRLLGVSEQKAQNFMGTFARYGFMHVMSDDPNALSCIPVEQYADEFFRDILNEAEMSTDDSNETAASHGCVVPLRLISGGGEVE
ncbi:hypothetical protein [Pseudochelatococcus contaminans]|uniref:Uncharacterized protein n=1 Tax=Pseudochelatococcus contaminans TaxID=1538103 RepID=A0A7W6EFC9_9HYPH|nr:hypothetical protein [Pseudochelatococcus contaminans]MBB3808774.1 hypothetical protein [Pseudochelatococcus contaminans]